MCLSYVCLSHVCLYSVFTDQKKKKKKERKENVLSLCCILLQHISNVAGMYLELPCPVFLVISFLLRACKNIINLWFKDKGHRSIFIAPNFNNSVSILALVFMSAQVE